MNEAGNACKGKVILKILLEDDALTLVFDNSKLILKDEANYCCERRYMTTDDTLDYWEGLVFAGYRIADGPPNRSGDYSYHDTKFLIVETFLGSFTVVTHNVHNGYYSGFDISEALVVYDKPMDSEDDDPLPVRESTLRRFGYHN